MNLNELLPNCDSAPACAPFTQNLSVDPIGSAFHANLVILVEVPLPWPKPVSEHPLLSGVFGLMRTAAVPTRVLACEPYRETGDRDEDGVGVVVFRSDASGYVRMDLVVEADELFETVAAECARTDLSGENVATTGTSAVGSESPRRSLLVCTQGSHDTCCGELGVPLADDVAAQHDDVDVFRVSHTGGHRFAPTALSMPDGRMWAFLTDSEVRSILERSGSPGDVASKCRGWIGAKKGAGQTAERAVFATADWQWDATPRSVEVHDAVVDSESPRSWDVAVRTGDRNWSVKVEVGREVPTISCSQPGGLPAKPSREFAVTYIE